MLLTDIEANGLLETVDKFHCAVTYDYTTQQYIEYRPHELGAYLDALEAEIAAGGLVVGHNFTKYDIPALTKLAEHQLGRKFNLECDQVLDTLVLSRLIFANLKDTDMKLLRNGTLPGKRFGSHALEAWGYRLGEMKGEYKDDFKKALEESGDEYTDGLEWLNFNEDMMAYNVQDVVVTKALFEHLCQQTFYFPNETPAGATESERFWNGSVEAVRLEHQTAWLCAKMERNGFPIDTKSLENLYAEISALRFGILQKLTDTFGSWYQPKGGTSPFRHPKTGEPLMNYPRVKYPKVGGLFKKPKNKAQREGTEPCEMDTRPYIKDCPYTPVEHIVFNPASRDHIIKVLKDAGWAPVDFTDNGAPKVDEEVLASVKVSDPKCQSAIELIREYLLIQKRIGQIAEGKNGWLRMIGEDGRIHGSVNPNGAVTGRATHSFPNTAQVPGSVRNKQGEFLYGVEHGWGTECREAWGAHHNKTNGKSDPWIQVGVDMSGIELRCLGHFMAPYDHGEYIETILNGDIHTKNQMAAGLPTRDNAKTFVYGFLN